MKEFFVFRLNRVKIFNNREWGNGELKLLSFITGDDNSLPMLDELTKVTDLKSKKNIIKLATKSVLSSKTLIQLDHIKDGHQATFGDTGYALYTSNKIPNSFTWSMMLIEIDEDIRQMGEHIDELMKGTSFDQFTTNILSLAGLAVNPAVVAGLAISKYVLKVVSNFMIQNKDDQVGLLYQSFNRWQHYPYGERKRDGIPDLSNNMLVDYSLFGMEYE